MAARQGASWTVSVGGRRALRGVALSLVGGTFLAHYLPQTLLIDKLKGVTQAYRKGLAIPTSPHVKALVAEVMGEMKMEEEERKAVCVYTSYGYDFFSAGSTHSSHGAILGVPASIRWQGVGEFDGTGVVVNNSPVPWSSPAGQALRDSLILSINAKKFAIARELSTIQRAEPIASAAVPPLALIVSYSISLGINKRLDLYAKPRGLRMCLYAIASLFGFGVYILGTDMGIVKSEGAGDGAAAAMGRGYAEGGVEFYTKILQRNVALRELMGTEGEALFTVKGNDEVLFRTKHLPYTARLDALQTHLKGYTEGAEGEVKGSTEGLEKGTT